MTVDDQDDTNTPDPDEDLQAKLDKALKENKALRSETLFHKAGLVDLSPEQVTAVKAVAGKGEWTPELLRTTALSLKFVEDKKKEEPPADENAGTIEPGVTPAGTPPAPPVYDPNLSVIDQINAASDQRQTLRQQTTGDDFNARMRRAATPSELMALIANDNGRHGILSDADIE